MAKGGGGVAALGCRGTICLKFLRLGLGKKALSCRLLEIMVGLYVGGDMDKATLSLHRTVHWWCRGWGRDMA